MTDQERDELESRVEDLEDAVRALATALRDSRSLVGDRNIINRLVINDLCEGLPTGMHLPSGRRS